jgi:phosphoglycerate dehydrogenase-like enzyme
VVVDRSELPSALAGADAAVTDRLTIADVERADRLRLVQAYSAGADRIDRAALPPGCALCNLHGPENAMAEWVLGAMVSLSRRVLFHDRELRRGDWHRGEQSARELAGSAVGTVGFGPIGRRVVELARAIGMDASAVTRTPSPERAEGLRRLGGLDEVASLAAEVDYLVVALPLNEETRSLVGALELEALGPDGYLVNVGRGEVVDERALYEALRDRRIAGAAIDVWYRYPRGSTYPTAPADLPFHELDNVLMSPHVSGTTIETETRRRAILLDQLERFARGSPLEHVIAVG